MPSTEWEVDRQIVWQKLELAASLIAESDFEWLVAEAVRIKADFCVLRQVEKTPQDVVMMTASSA